MVSSSSSFDASGAPGIPGSPGTSGATGAAGPSGGPRTTDGRPPEDGTRAEAPIPTDATRLLHRMADGDAKAAADLLPLVYDELHRIASVQMRGERRDHTLQPTAIVHEAYLRLVQGESIKWQSRAHFLAVAAGAIRRVLIDHARRTGAQKRGGDRQRVVLDERADATRGPDLDLLDLNDALDRLANVNPRQSRIVELRFFGGLTNEEVAEVMGLSRATISDEWAFARAWLAKELEVGSS